MTKREWRKRQAVARYWIARMRQIIGTPAQRPPTSFMQRPLWLNTSRRA